ncbi:uncharacterized protein MELLADRAFT_93380 [Melampsora larici-populina 98AG31]|uniref:CxC5 like cysteine cluster associated with KDZ domain-containing protein n=1 Tax=Melampsora larici-populina (strain 98AG31 / pathotype 3-4-7) TaxID=747676 RepID=F4RA64_MELLP|nr:uncharacterized protein MELLADRAFT_93380 [Melampsora larici-populina 98AG31]EGG10837.1 hypothetical protein MELLADRAFT_93380 [Melampsora larici-populina 98AG31]
MLLHNFVAHIANTSPQLSATLTVADFVQFISLASEVQHSAGVALRLTSNRSVLAFLTTALTPQFANHLMQDLWSLSFPYLTCFDPVGAIRTFGHHSDLTTPIHERYLRPPVSHCLACPKACKLHVHTRLNGYLFDTDGVHTVQTVILDCPGCNAMYRPSYYTHNGMRHYCTLQMGRDDTILHVHCHYYITNRLGHLFRVIQMLAHVSHFNLTNWYNEIYVEEVDIPQFNKGFSPAMSEAVCLDGLELRALIGHKDRRQQQLSLPAKGNDDVRLDEAIASHLEKLDIEGTRFRDHYCSSCVRVNSGGIDPDTGEEILMGIRAVVTDGLTIGHWRCSASTDQLAELAKNSGQPSPEGPCTNRLQNINDWFCTYHYGLLGNRCHAQPC